MAIRTLHMIPTPLERAAGRFMRGPDHEEADEGLDNDEDGVDDDEQSGQSGDDDEHQDGDTDGSDPDDDEDSDGKPKSRRNGYEKRIDRLTRRAKDAEDELARLRSGKGGKPDEKPNGASKGGEPLLKDFENYEDYIDARIDYRAEQKLNASKAETEKAKAETDFLKRFNTGRKSFKDWDDVVTNDVNITTAMQNAIKESDIPADIIYWLGQNPDEAERIFDLPAGKQALAIGKIEARLEGKKSDRSGNNERRSSNAPEPIKPTTSSGKKISKSYEDMSYGEFVAQRRADARRAQGIRT